MGLRIAFFGLPLAACLLAGDGHDIAVAFVNRKDAVGRRRLARLIGADRLVTTGFGDGALARAVARVEPDLVVSWFWTRRIPPAVLGVPSRGTLGVHPSLLPRHRGPDPTYWAILRGDAVTGVTAHRLAAEYDTGAILASEELVIRDSWNAFDLAKALDRPSLRLLRATIRRIEAGPVEEREQDESVATLAPFPNEEDHELRWAQPTIAVLRQIRALAPQPGAFTELGGELVTVLRASAAPAPRVLEVPGEAMLVDGLPVVRTADGAVRIDAAELDGDSLEPEDWVEVFH
ncbi:MAG: methionyl-tRNA formyltransferase [Polyangiaceae bacterium]